MRENLLALSQFLSGEIFRHFYPYLFSVFVLLCSSALALNAKFASEASSSPSPDARPFRIGVAHLAIGLVASVVLFALIQSHLDITFQDSVFLYPTAAAGKPQWIPFPIWPGEGRFFPLGFQEFQLFALISKSVTFYVFCLSLQFLITFLVATSLVKAGRFVSGLFAACLLTCPMVLYNLIWPICHEPCVIFFFIFALFFAARYFECGSWIALILSTCCAAATCYFKEVAFLLGGSSGVAFIASAYFDKTLPHRRRYIVLGSVFIMASVLWLATYLLAIFPQINTAYFVKHNLGNTRLQVIIDFAKNIWIWALFAALALRVGMRRKLPLNPVIDCLPLAALAYTAAILYLRFSKTWYTAPAAWLAFAYIAYVLSKIPAKAAFAFAAVCVAFQAGPSFAKYQEFKETMAARSQALRYIEHKASAPLVIHARNVEPYTAGLFAGSLQALSGKPVQISVDGDEDWSEKKRCVSGWQDITAKNDAEYWSHRFEEVVCDANLPVQAGHYVLSFEKPLEHAAWPLVFASKPIGWWKNHYRVYVYRAD